MAIAALPPNESVPITPTEMELEPLSLWVIVLLTELAFRTATYMAASIGAAEREERQLIRSKQLEVRRKRDPSQFVEASKLERQVIALEKTAAAHKLQREQRSARCGTVVTWLRRAVWAALVFVSRVGGVPVLRLSSANTSGLGWLLGLGTGADAAGWVGAPAGVFLLQRGVGVCIARAGLAPPVEPKKGGLGGLLSAVGLG